MPIFHKYVGTHRIEMDTSGATRVIVKENQKLEATCDLYIQRPEILKITKIIYTVCKAQFLYVSADFDVNKGSEYFWTGTSFECYYPQLKLYESKSNFEWCPSNATSYNLATMNFWSPPESLYIITAGICFDIYTSSFRSIYYAIGPNKTENLQPHIFESSYDLGLDLEYIQETFGYNSLSETVFQNAQRIWIDDFRYDFSSVIQHPKLEKMFNDKFSTLLEFMWWPNLRKNNWERYIVALKEHMEKDHKSYDVLAGVSGSIKVPVLQACQKKYSLEEVIYNMKKRIPQYVWNYLQDRSNNSNKIVIIGLNSPIYELSQQDDIIFCPDKCHEVSWLKDASSSFRYSMMGTIFCCSVEDARFSRHLDGFPDNDFLPEQIVTTEVPIELDVEEATEVNDIEDNN